MVESLVCSMAEKFTAVLEWSGSVEIGQRLSNLVPDNVKSELVVSNDLATLTITIEGDSLEQLRESVDATLALFSDYD